MDRQENFQEPIIDQKQLTTAPEGYIHVAEARRDRRLEPVQFMECCTDAEVEQFVALRNELPERHRLMLTQYTAEQYRREEAKLFLADNGGGGYGMLEGGEIISVFSLPGYKLGRAIIEDAILRGGNKVECFDIGNKLPQIYRQFGFVETERFLWNPADAPQGWNYQKYNTPDVVVMEIQPH